MSYTPLRLLHDATPFPAKAATAAKEGVAAPSGAICEPRTRPAVEALAALAAEAPRNASDHNLAERAAIVQEGAGVPANWADGFAELEGRPAPPGVSGTVWLAMIDAAGRFLDAWGGKAASLGWTAGELFGLDANAPMNRLDHRGAAFFLANAEVLAVTGEAITLRKGGAVHRVYRRGRFAAPAWEGQQ